MRTMMRSLRRIVPALLGILAVFVLMLSFSSASGQEQSEPAQARSDELVSIHTQLAAQPPNPGAGLSGYDELAAAVEGEVVVSVNGATGVASFLRILDGAALTLVPNVGAAAQAEAFLAEHGGLFGVTDPDNELVLVDTRVDNLGRTHLTYQQVYQGVPVFAGVLKIHFNNEDAITSANGVFIPNLALDSSPSVAASAAEETAVSAVRLNPELGAADKALSALGTNVFVFRAGLVKGVVGPNHLVYEVEVGDTALTVREMVYIDAHTGKFVDQISRIHEIEREVSETSLANVIWDEGNGDPNPIPAGWMGGTAQQVTDWQNEVDGAGETYNLIASMTSGVYLSYDGADAIMRTVNNDPNINCPNANWNGTSTNYCSNVTGDDTVAHEWGHAYTEYTNNLIYQWQSGALNESYSDIWGEAVDLLNGRGTDTPDVTRPSNTCSSNVAGANFPGNPTVDTVRWLSGEDDPAFFGIPAGSGNAIRDMWDPTCFGDPGKVTDQAEYICTTFDNGGVHINSGIPNHAFALMVDGGTYNSQTVTPISVTKAAHIHWAAQNMLTPSSDFSDHADALEAACTSLIGVNLPALSTSTTNAGLSGEMITAADCTQVSNAIAAVEFRTEPTFCNFEPLLDPNAPAICGGGPVQSISSTDFESGLGSWTVGTRDVANPATFDTPDWAVVGSLPESRPGQAAFVADLIIGDCAADDETGVLYMDSPVINIPAGATFPSVAFDHWVATETGWDGGNVKVSVNGGPWTLISSAAYTFNAYNSTLNTSGAGNTNPLAGEAAFTGTDGGSVGGTWGQSQVDLSGIAAAGDNIQLRFDFGIDGCNGVIGWYVDDVEVYSCSAPPEASITVIPDALTTTLIADRVFTATLTISNTGAANLDWSIDEDATPRLPKFASRAVPVVKPAADTVTIGDFAFSTYAGAALTPSGPAATKPAGAGSTTITHSASQTITSGNSVSCNAGGLHADNSYIRAFDLNAFGITGNFDVTSVDIGIEAATAGSGGAQPADLNLYTWNPTDPFTFANFTPIGSASVMVPDQSLAIYTIPVTGTAIAGSVLVVEFYTPDGQSAGHSLFVGSNSAGQTAPTFLAAAACGLPEPTDTGSVGFPNMHLVMNVTGNVTAAAVCDAPIDIPWLSVDPITGTVAGTSSMPVHVAYDSTGLSTGTYTGTLCVNSNDMMNPRVKVPVTMTVVSTATYGVDVSGPQTLEGAPGQTVTFTVHITNTGNAADVYSISATGNSWPTALSSTNVPVNVGSTGTVMVSVDIPAGASGGDTDMVTIQATSQGNGTMTDSTVLTTEAMYPQFLPFIKKE